MMSRERRRPLSRPPTPKRPPAVREAVPSATAPTLLRDGWSWLAALAVLPLLAACHGAPLGEPVAEDFDFLHRALLEGTHTLLDGGGSTAFWRPLAHQVYYAALDRLVLTHPGAVAALHALALAAGAMLLARAFRAGLGGPAAAAAAAFPLLAESTRTLVGWPTQFVDVGLFCFSALALHSAARRRLPLALASLLAALLCKEIAVVTAVMLPLLPGPAPRRERARTAFAAGVLVAAWAAAYMAVRHAAHLELPHGLEHVEGALAPTIADRLAWAFGGSLRSAFSLALQPGRWDVVALAAALALLVAGGVSAATSRRARTLLLARRGWLAWGLAWFALATLTLTPIFPLWQPNRAMIGGIGLGVALAAALEAAHPALLAALVAVRLGMLALAPGAALTISDAPPDTGAFMDFAHLTRLQRFMRAMRLELRAASPGLPHGAYVVRNNMPTGLTYAFGQDRALQVWYRDSTLRMVSFDTFREHPGLPVAIVIQFQPHERDELVAMPPEPYRLQESGFRALRADRIDEALATLARAESLGREPRARVFHADIAGARAFALEVAGRHAEAGPEARRALAIDAHNENARLALAAMALQGGRLDEAERILDEIRADDPGLAAEASLRAGLAAQRRARGVASPIRR